MINLPGAVCATAKLMVTTKNKTTKSFVVILARMMICYQISILNAKINCICIQTVIQLKIYVHIDFMVLL